LRHVLNRSGLIVQMAVLGLFVTTAATFGWAIVRTGHFVVDLVDRGLKAPLDALYHAAAIGALVVAFTWFRTVKGGAKPPAVAALPGTAPYPTPAQPADS
jgi:hypothetical protein